MERAEMLMGDTRMYLENGGPYTLSLRCEVTLDHQIDRAAMQVALVRASRFYPQLMSRIEWTDGKLYYVPNELPLRLFVHEDETCELGSEQTDGYLHRNWAEGNRFVTLFNHGLGDGAFALSFVRTLLCCYAEEIGVAKKGDTVHEDAVLTSSATSDADPTVELAQPVQAQTPPPDMGPLFGIPESYWDEQGKRIHRRFSLQVPYDQLSDLAHRSGSRMSPLLMALEARALMRAWDTADASLLGCITVDLRRLFGVSCPYNFSGYVIAMLPSMLAQADLAVQCAALQQGMESQLTKEAMAAQLDTIVTTAETLLAQGPEGLASYYEQRAPGVRQSRSYLGLYVANLGALRLPPQVAKMVKGAQVTLPNHATPYNLTVVTAGGVTALGLTQAFESDALFQGLIDEMKAQGLDVVAEDQGVHQAPMTMMEHFA